MTCTSCGATMQQGMPACLSCGALKAGVEGEPDPRTRDLVDFAAQLERRLDEAQNDFEAWAVVPWLTSLAATVPLGFWMRSMQMPWWLVAICEVLFVAAGFVVFGALLGAAARRAEERCWVQVVTPLVDVFVQEKGLTRLEFSLLVERHAKGQERLRARVLGLVRRGG